MKIIFGAIALASVVAASDASAQGINLSGPWQCLASCLAPQGSLAYITQNGWNLNIVNEAGMHREPGSIIRDTYGSTGRTKARFTPPTVSRFSSTVERSGSAPQSCLRRLFQPVGNARDTDRISAYRVEPPRQRPITAATRSNDASRQGLWRRPPAQAKRRH